MKIDNLIIINKQEKYVMLSASITLLCTCLFSISNILFNNDMIMSFANEPGRIIDYIFAGASSYRPFLEATECLFISWYKTPMIALIWNVLFIAIIGKIVVDVFKVQSIVRCILIGMLLGTSPTICNLCDSRCVAYLFAPMIMLYSVFMLANKNWGTFFVGAIGMCWGFGIFPPAISSVVLLMIVYWMLLILEADKSSLKDNVSHVLRQIGIILIGLISLIVICKILNGVSGTGLTSYQGLGEFSSNIEASAQANGIKNIPGIGMLVSLFSVAFSNIKYVLSSAINICWRTAYIMGTYKIFLLLYYAIALVSIVLLCLKKRKNLNVYQWGIMFFCLSLLPFSIATMSIISPHFSYHTQHRVVWTILLVCIVPIWERVDNLLINEKCSKIELMNKIVSIIVLLICVGCYMKTNIDFNSSWYTSQQDRALCLRILNSLDGNTEFDYNENPVYFVNITSIENNEQLTNPERYDMDLYNVGPRIDKETNLWCYGDGPIKSHMMNLEGVRFINAPYEIIDSIEKSDIRERYSDLLKWEYEIFRYENTDVFVVVFRTIISNAAYLE